MERSALSERRPDLLDGYVRAGSFHRRYTVLIEPALVEALAFQSPSGTTNLEIRDPVARHADELVSVAAHDEIDAVFLREAVKRKIAALEFKRN